MEIWRPAPELEDRYQISSLGRLRHLKDLSNIKNPRQKKKGYMAYRVGIKGRRVDIYVHKLVARAFIGVRPLKYVVDHINSDKTDNRVENLRYITNRENTVRGRSCLQRATLTSKYPGVSATPSGKWVAQAHSEGKARYLGTYVKEEEAASAYAKFVGELG